MLYGYIRVSTKLQNTERQEDAQDDLNIPAENLFIEKQSGKDFDRPVYKNLVEKLQKGDTLFIKSIDRLECDYDSILEQWRIITKEKGADIVVLDMKLLDTRAKPEDITGTFVADLVLQILAYVAQKEREFNHQRQKEGIMAARARGVQFGRKAKERPNEYKELKSLYGRQKISSRDAAKKLGICHTTFLKWVKEDQELPGKKNKVYLTGFCCI